MDYNTSMDNPGFFQSREVTCWCKHQWQYHWQAPPTISFRWGGLGVS